MKRGFGYYDNIEVIKLLRRLDIIDRNIVAPLSYGDEEYSDSILKEGKRILGNTPNQY